MKQYTTYIFDLDGTLLDTLEDLTASTNYVMSKMGMPQHTMEEVRAFVGNGIRKLIERAVPGGLSNPDYERAYEEFLRHYSVHNMDRTAPYEGIVAMLEALKKRGCRIAVVSNKYYLSTQALCRHFFGELVEVSIGEREGIRKKPAPDTVEEALRQLGVGKEGAVYVGDSEVDIATAANSGLPCISVLWGFRSKELLEKHGATEFVSSPADLFNS